MKTGLAVVCCCLLLCYKSNAQLFSLGAKWEEKLMFELSINQPLFWKNDGKFDLLLGANFTTGNKKWPSGLQPQFTGIYRIVDNKYKEYFFSFQLTAGYLFDFNTAFKNQLRISPHVYFEYNALFYIKAGYDFYTPLNLGYPYISVGIGGLCMLKHFRIM